MAHAGNVKLSPAFDKGNWGRNRIREIGVVTEFCDTFVAQKSLNKSIGYHGGRIMAVKISELIDALAFASGPDYFGNEAYVNRETDRVVLVSDEFCDAEDMPDTLDPDVWVQIPQKAELDLGVHLVTGFVGEFMPDLEMTVRGIFQKKGAYARFKTLLEAQGQLKRWYEYEEANTVDALQNWCVENRIVYEGQ